MQPGPAPRFALCFSCLHQPLHSLVPLLMRIKAVGSGWHHAWHRAGLIEHLPDASAALCDLRPRQAAEGRCHRRRTRLEVCWLPGPRAALRAAQAPPSPRGLPWGRSGCSQEPPATPPVRASGISPLSWRGSLVRWPRVASGPACTSFPGCGAQGEASSSSCYIPSALQAVAECVSFPQEFLQNPRL